jgi:hypothetical protein
MDPTTQLVDDLVGVDDLASGDRIHIDICYVCFFWSLTMGIVEIGAGIEAVLFEWMF